jgi:hypothetical protein
MISTTSFSYFVVNRVTVEPTLESEGSIDEERIVTMLTPTNIIANPDRIKLMRTEGIIPYNGDLFSGTTSTWEDTCRFRSYSAETMPGGLAMRVRLKWTTRYVLDPVQVRLATPLYEYVLPVSCEYSVRTRTLLLYRTGWTTQPPAASDTTAADIGGTTITGADQGVSTQVSQVAVRVRFLQDASFTPMDNLAASLTAYIGTRNNAAFLSFPTNSLTCEGISFSDVAEEYYEVAFEFLYDRYYGHEQVPQYDADGKPARSGSNLLRVDWKRNPLSGANFNLIYGANARLQTRVEQGYWS